MNIERRDLLIALAGTAAATSIGGNTLAFASGEALTHPNLAADPRRPQFHFLPAANWMNDPNGPIYWNGYYHMFYQYNPHGAFWADMHWGHAISKDMVHWKHLPIALSPTPGAPDSEGCFSGTAVVRDGRVLLFYTGVQSVAYGEATNKDGANTFRETQCCAVANDPDLQSWSKLSRPVISDPPRGMSVNGFRDPSPWRQGDWWYMVLGSGHASHGGAVLLYRSKDLRSWEFIHDLVHQDFDSNGNFSPFDPWDVWECPEFFALEDKHVLIYSTHGKVYWRSGRLDQDSMKFSTEHTGFLDYGTYYAPKTQLDKLGRRIIWGWIQERRPLEEYKAAGWAGVMSLPRVLSLEKNGRLKIEFADALDQLRTREESLQMASDEESNQRKLKSIRIRDCCGELLCKVRRSTTPVQISLTGSVDKLNPWLTCAYDPSNPNNVIIDSHSVPISLRENEELELHLYADGSVLELCVNKQVAWTKRFYAKSDASQDLCLNWTGNTSDIASLTIWQIAPISNDRLTT